MISINRTSVQQSQSVWSATTAQLSFTPLDRNITANVCIIGAGISGLTTAYLLMKAGLDVVILDDGPIGGGMTQSTTAHLSNAIDARYYEIERLHGEKGATYTAESHTSAINMIENIVEAEKMECAFRRVNGYLFLAPNHPREILARELTACHRAGLADVELLEAAPGLSLHESPCLRFPRQAQFHPLVYLSGLAGAINRGSERFTSGQGQGSGHIFTETHADKITGGDEASVSANGHTVDCDAIVVATNSPVNDVLAVHTKQTPFMTYAIGAAIPSDALPQVLYWDTADPYHYVRLQTLNDDERAYAGGDAREILIVGGEDHKTGRVNDTIERHGRLETWMREHFPMAEEVQFVWSGQVMETIDSLAFIGRNPGDEKNVFIATGDCGMGMTHGTIAGILLSDLIQGRTNPWEELYNPSRKTIGAAGQFVKEAMAMAAQYGDWLTGGDVASTGEISSGAGAVMRQGLSKVAVYRDEEGILHTVSAVCPHLGGIVRWNAAEKTWDCPCHGSRFDRYGKAINGPANSDLSAIDNEDKRKTQ